MRRHFVALYALVPLHDLLRVDGQLLVGVDHDAEEAGVCLEGGEKGVSACLVSCYCQDWLSGT